MDRWARGMWLFRRSHVPSQSEEEGVQVEQGWCVRRTESVTQGEDTEGGKVSVVQRAPELVGQLYNAVPFVPSLPALHSCLVSLPWMAKPVWLWAIWAFKKSAESLFPLQVCCSSKTQLPQIYLDTYMLCPIISSSRRNFSKIFFNMIMPPIGFPFFNFFLFKVLVALGRGTWWHDCSVCSNLLEIRRVIISPVHLSFRDLKYTQTESSLF